MLPHPDHTPAWETVRDILHHERRVNTLVSGGTGSGKTTLLNCLTQFIDDDERIITCEDAAELQLQQPHVVRLETRPPNLEGEGQVTMRELVRNCLRMRPERIIVGEVRGPEAFDLLQAMNTGHDGSMGTLHANIPREALSRLESMITMGGFSLPSRTIREMICASVDVVIQAARLRDGSRRITHITEVMGMEGDVIITQDLFVYDMIGEDAQGQHPRPPPLDRHRPAAVLGPRPLLRRGKAARRGARCRRSRRAKPMSARERHADDRRVFLAALAVGGVAWVFLYPILSGERKAEQRWRASPAGAGGARTRAQPEVAPRHRREHAQGNRGAPQEEKRVPLPVRIAQAGLTWSKRQFIIISAAIGVALSCSACSSAPACWPPSARLCRRIRPAALDAVVPQEAARSEVSQRLSGRRRHHRARHQGRPAAARLPEDDHHRLAGAGEVANSAPSSKRRPSACRSARPAASSTSGCRCRKPTSSASSIAIQQKAGGNLSEALGNLSRVLRDRKKMKAKIKAMSKEAKASAAIIGCVAARGDDAGLDHQPAIHLAVVDRAARPADAGRLRDLDVCGVIVMKKMINFDF